MVLSLRTCGATGARDTGTGQAIVPLQPRGRERTRVSKAMGKEKDFTVITKVKERGPRVMARVGASTCSAPTAGNVDMPRPIAGLCTLTRCRGRRLRKIEEEDVAVGGNWFRRGFCGRGDFTSWYL